MFAGSEHPAGGHPPRRTHRERNRTGRGEAAPPSRAERGETKSERGKSRSFPVADHPAIGVLAVLALIAITVIVWRGALAYYFSQDDFGGLARARNLAPRLVSPMRYLSHQAYWDLMRPFGVASAWSFHAVSIAAHAACAVVLYLLFARRFARPPAFLAAAFFATHPMLFTALHWASAVGDPFALLFALLALALALGTRNRWWALPCFALSLLFKESCLMLPAVVFAHRRWGTAGDRRAAAQGPRGPDPVLGGLWLMSVVASQWLVFVSYRSDVSGASGSVSPYALGGPGLVLTNALTYLGWTANFWFPTVRGFPESIDRMVWPWAFGLVVAWVVGVGFRALRQRGWMAAALTYAAFIVPVLPLGHHTYHYYLYPALVGVAWGVAALGDLVMAQRRAPSRQWAWAATAALALVLTINALSLVHRIETMPFVHPELRADATIDRARIARNVYEGLRVAAPADGARLAFWVPPSGPPPGRSSSVESDRYYTDNVRTALLDGLAVRVMFPQIVDVSFMSPSDTPVGSQQVAVCTPGGHLRLMAAGDFNAGPLRARAPP